MRDVLALLGSDIDILSSSTTDGGEDALLQGDLSWLARVNAIIAELHPQLVDPHSIVERVHGTRLPPPSPDSLWPDSMDMFIRPPRTWLS